MKSLISVINEGFNDIAYANFHIFFMVKVGPDKNNIFYCMTENIRYESDITPKTNVKTLDTLKKFAWKCFFEMKPKYLEYYGSYAHDGFEPVIISAQMLDIKRDPMKPWQRNTLNAYLQQTNALNLESLGPKFETYKKAFNIACDERQKELEKLQNIKRAKEAADREERQKAFAEYKAQFIKDHSDDPYYQIYGWPWERTSNYVGD